MGNAAQHCRLGLFQDSGFAGDLEDPKSTSGGVLCISGSRTFVPIRWMCRKQTSVSHRSTESEIISLDAGLCMDGLLALDVWDLVIEVLRTTQGIPKLKPAHGKLVQYNKAHERLNKCGIRMWIYRTWIKFLRTHISLRRHLYIFEDDEAVIKMIIKGRSPTMRHVSRTHRVALDWLFDRINLDAKIQMKYVESQNQLAYILTKGSFTRGEWHTLLQFFFNIMSDTTFFCSHLSNSHLFLSDGKQSEMSKRSQESSSPSSPMVKARACCLVSRYSVSVGQNSSSNHLKPGGCTRYSQEWNQGERSANSGSYSVQLATGNREHGPENSGGLSETPAVGRETVNTCERSFRM